MSINSTNSKVLFITSKGNSCRVVSAQPQIHLNDSLIETCSSAKRLGVTVCHGQPINMIPLRNVIRISILLSLIKVYLSVDNQKRFYNA